MDHDQLEQYKKEYYETLEANPSLHPLLNTHGGLILARVGSHPPWPARFSEPGEFAKMSRHRTKKGLLCVYFFGTRNYGWVKPSAIMPFSNDLTSLKPARKYSPAMVQRAIAAMAEAKVVLNDTDEYQMCFYDRIMDRKDEPVDLPCELCNRVEDHFSLLILCDGKGCGREFHMGCFRPPMEKVPIGDWYCPECEKDPSKQVKGTEESAPESRDGSSSRVSRPSSESAPLEQTSGGEMAKKVKKEKLKAGELGSLKRKLPGSAREKGKRADADESPVKGAKKARSQRSLHADGLMQSSPEQASSRPSTPTSSGSRRGASGELHAPMHQGRDGAAIESEERCLLCGYGGELVVCEFSGCTKVYHQFCLGAYPFPKDEDATWFCPRHTCALSGIREVVEVSDGTTSAPKPARKSSTKKQLWKCSTCPVALSDDAMPTIPKAMIVSKPNRSFQCAFCSSSAPLKVQLAKQLERIWSMMATNRQGMPFCGPIFPGLPRPTDRAEPLNLFTILAKIRRLEYNDSASFASDVRDVVEYALEVVRDSPQPLSEAARTMTIVCEEQLMIHRTKLDALEAKIAELKPSIKAKKLLEVGLITGFPGEKRRWPLRWRQECGAWEEKGYPIVESRSLSEWIAYITTAPLYASCDELDDMGARTASSVTSSEPERRLTETQEGVPSENSAIDEPDPAQQFPAFPGLTLSEGADVMIALTELSRHNGDSTRNFGGWQEREIDDVDGRDFFLSPSATEMQQMFDQQSVLLRRALEGHAALQKAWLVSKQRLLGLGGDVGLSVGEGRIAAELRVANKNLRARLRNKDKLVDQLSNEHFKLRAEVKSLQAELAQLKGEAPDVEEASTARGDNASTVSIAGEAAIDMETGSPTRKSTRPAVKVRAEKKTKAAAAKAGRKVVERKSG
ncbi:hypothetical protein PINS_up003232 [Pythium insidiosum]|nr:hypothetical protein PINS_up003232 [Pythium insidiosum]